MPRTSPPTAGPAASGRVKSAWVGSAMLCVPSRTWVASSWTLLIASWLVALIAIVLTLVRPKIRCAAVVTGTTTWSSWLKKPPAVPFDANTPTTSSRTTRTGAFRPPDEKLRLMYWPTASPPLNRFSAVVDPMTATCVADETSAAVKNAPLAIVQLRTVRNSGVVPVT